MDLKPNEKLNIEYILKDLDKYRPRRRGWIWRDGIGGKRDNWGGNLNTMI